MSKVQKSRDRHRALVEELEHRIGDDLIGVGYHSDDDWQPLYMRDDFADRYTYEEMEQMAESVILEGLLTSTKESVWGFGRMDFKMAYFENAVIFHFPLGDMQGLAVGVDRMPMSELDAIVSTCMDQLPELGED